MEQPSEPLETGIATLIKEPRISVAMTREEQTELADLARRCSTSVSALGQLAIRHMLIQSRTGAVPLIPNAMTMPSVIEELDEQIALSQIKINSLQAQCNLDYIDKLTEG